MDGLRIFRFHSFLHSPRGLKHCCFGLGELVGGVIDAIGGDLYGANVVQPLAAESLRVVLAPTSEPQMQLLHILERDFVEQVIIGLADRPISF